MKKEGGSHIVLVTKDIDEVKLLLSILNNSFQRVLVIGEVELLVEQLIEDTTKVFLISNEVFHESLSFYYAAMDKVGNRAICEHSVVTLISRLQENSAFDAVKCGIVDDYLVARPLYELHRPVVICQRLLEMMGVIMPSEKSEDFLIRHSLFSDEAKVVIEQGVNRKNELKDAFSQSLRNIDKALDEASDKIQHDQKVKLDLDILKNTLSAIRSDAIRPELLKLQSKAINLLQKIISEDADEVDAQAIIDSATEVKKSVPEPSFNKLHNTGITKLDIATPPVKKEPPKLLLVEDDEVSLNITLGLFKHLNVHIETAVSGRRAFDVLMKTKFDLILMDIFLPDTNGLYLLNQVCNTQSINKETPVIMLTGSSNKATVRKAIMTGAKGYIIKPLCKNVILKLFEKYQLVLTRKKV